MISRFGPEYMPRRKTKHSAGYDFFMTGEPVTFKAGLRYLVDTGICLEDGDIPDDSFIMLLPRSSMRKKYGMSFYGAGVIDSDYRDSIQIILKVDEDMDINPGERIAQGIVMRFGRIAGEIEPVEERKGGFGSTGQ